MPQDVTDIVIAVTKLEGAVTSLQLAFENKSVEDLVRFDKIETNVNQHTAVLSAHADLHTSHARLITKANELAIAAAEKAEQVRTEAQKELKTALDKHAVDTSAKLDSLAEAATERSKTLDKIVEWQKKPLFKAAWFVGGLIGGALAAYVAAHH